MDDSQLINGLNIVCTKLTNNLDRNTVNLSVVKYLEKLILFDIIKLSPLSLIHKNKSHRSKEDSQKKFIINTVSLTSCIMQYGSDKPTLINTKNGGSYIDLLDTKLYYYKNSKSQPIIFDLTSCNEKIVYLYKLKNDLNYELVLFSNSNLNCYPLYYKDSNKKHCGFANDYYDIVKTELSTILDDKYIPKSINDIFKNIHESQEIIVNNNLLNGGGATQGNTENIDNTNIIQKKWEDIFQVTGILPKDCSCGEYSNAVHNRCVIIGKPIRGLRPVHKPGCTKIIRPLEDF
tara:strand:- start:9453 stop:10322 length:870 start_codon:yes stop_codon:yes gene_type:complete